MGLHGTIKVELTFFLVTEQVKKKKRRKKETQFEYFYVESFWVLCLEAHNHKAVIVVLQADFIVYVIFIQIYELLI